MKLLLPRLSFRSAVAVIAVYLSLGAAKAQAAVWPVDPTIPNSLGVQLKGNTDNPEDLDAVKELGMKWVRRGFIWEAVEKTQGVYDFSVFDTFVSNCEARGLSIIGCIAFSNKLYGHAKDEPGRSAYAKYAAALAAHYKGRNIIWEIWNEPNTMTFWGKHGKKGNSEPYAEEYTNLVKATVPAMKKANPNCVILGGSVSNMWTESYKWMDFVFAKGILKTKLDAWSVHPYGLKAPEDYHEAYAIMHKSMAAAGGPADIPVVNTERGFPLGKAEGYAGGDPKQSYEYQAWHLVRQYLVDLLEGVRITSWYEWGGKEGFALYRPGEPTPAFNACKVFIAELKGYRLDKRIDLKDPRDFVVRFTNPAGGIKLVAWTSPPPMQTPDKAVPHAVTVPVQASGTLETVQIYGEKGTVPVNSSSIELNLTGAPQYIVLKK